MEELTITVSIAGRSYRLSIGKNEEELVRRGAKLIDIKMKDYANDYAFKDQQDLLAMVALQFASSTLNFEEEAAYRDTTLTAKLQEFDNILSAVSG
ncbi:MAG TPA: cell division protein ZapA [Bacteroidales bacterium]|nr:cell division protein ZapA [Bacteroidales bacterium]